MKIQLKKGDKCPICRRNIVKPNCWIRFHIEYNPEKVILACKYCNLIERQLRLRQNISFNTRNPHTPNRPARSEMVVQYLKKFGIIYT